MPASVATLGFPLLAVTATSAVAVPRSTPNVTFFQGGAGTAQWVGGESSDPADNDQAIALGIPAAGDYAGALLNRTDESAPEVPPSFQFRTSVTNDSSGGSPRLVILWSDGGTSELRPLSWDTTDWTPVDGTGPNWDNNGGACGYLYATNYAQTKACHTGATVVSVFLATDSGWLASPYTHYIDEVSYDGVTFSSASDNRRVPQGS